MAVHLGYYHFAPAFSQETQARARAGDPTPDPAFVRKVVELTDKLPAGCTLVGAYVPHGLLYTATPDPTQPAVMVVETDNAADVNFISQYYQGYVSFRWTPATSVGATRAEREANTAAAAGRQP